MRPRFIDEWSDDDPAVRRLRDAIQGPPEAPERLERPDPVPAAAPAQSKAARVSALIARIRAGDLSAVDQLRDLLA